MNSIRKIKKIWKSQPTIEGAGVHLKRAFGNAQVPQFDPFLMLDDFHSSNPADYLPGFPWHPHRGIETITYVQEGLVEHGDSMGNKGVISAGDVQWMTAGSGIIHQEMPKESPTGTMWGFQFWANLPASQKMMPPRYRDVKAAEIPEVTLAGGVKIKVVAGTVGNVQGPVQGIVIEPEMLDIRGHDKGQPLKMDFNCPLSVADPSRPFHLITLTLGFKGRKVLSKILAFSRDNGELHWEFEYIDTPSLSLWGGDVRLPGYCGYRDSPGGKGYRD